MKKPNLDFKTKNQSWILKPWPDFRFPKLGTHATHAMPSMQLACQSLIETFQIDIGTHLA